MLQAELSDIVRAAIIARIGLGRHTESLELLASLLDDTNWRIRSAISDAMVALTPESVPVLQKLLLHGNPAAKAAAVQALKRSGQDEWLEAQLSLLSSQIQSPPCLLVSTS